MIKLKDGLVYWWTIPVVSMIVLTKVFVFDFYNTSKNNSSDYNIKRVGIIEKPLLYNNDFRIDDVVSYNNGTDYKVFGYRIGIIKSINDNKAILLSREADGKLKQKEIMLKQITGKIK